MVAMAEQQQYLRHDNNSGSRLTALTPVMPDGNSGSIQIVEGEYCPDLTYVRFEEKLPEKEAQNETLEACQLSKTLDTDLSHCL